MTPALWAFLAFIALGSLSLLGWYIYHETQEHKSPPPPPSPSSLPSPPTPSSPPFAPPTGLKWIMVDDFKDGNVPTWIVSANAYPQNLLCLSYFDQSGEQYATSGFVACNGQDLNQSYTYVPDSNHPTISSKDTGTRPYIGCYNNECTAYDASVGQNAGPQHMPSDTNASTWQVDPDPSDPYQATFIVGNNLDDTVSANSTSNAACLDAFKCLQEHTDTCDVILTNVYNNGSCGPNSSTYSTQTFLLATQSSIS